MISDRTLYCSSLRMYSIIRVLALLGIVRGVNRMAYINAEGEWNRLYLSTDE